MKVINKFMFPLAALVIFVSCEGKRSENKQEGSVEQAQSEPKSADIRTVELDISGMTCEIGCAKLIQSKLYKTDGVSFAEVRFADSTGLVSYDSNRLTEKDLKDVVEAAGGGDLYRVRSISVADDQADKADSAETAQ